MKNLRVPFITILAIMILLACDPVPPTPTQFVFPTVASPQLALNPQSSSGLLTSTSVPTSTLTTTPINTPTYTVVTSHPLGIHVVRFGEWLYCIGRAYRVLPSAIATVNGLRSPDVIFPGQRLTIPNTPWTNIPTGPICKAQFTVLGSPPTPTLTTDTFEVPLTPVPIATTRNCDPSGNCNNLSCILCIDGAEMIHTNQDQIFDQPAKTALCLSYSPFPSNPNVSPTPTPNIPFASSGSIHVLWDESGAPNNVQTSIKVYMKDQNQNWKPDPVYKITYPSTGNRTCRIRDIPITDTGTYKTEISLGNTNISGRATVLFWSIGD